MHNNTPIPDKRRRPNDKAGEGIIEFTGDGAARQLVTELAAEVAYLAGGELGGVAGGLFACEVGVEVCAGGGAEAGGIDRFFVDVEGWWGGLVGGVGIGGWNEGEERKREVRRTEWSALGGEVELVLDIRAVTLGASSDLDEA